ncbi:MAG: hypothetical protein K2P84_10920 [Undibacterium sp.]|nr:hypothetical protein [Undibacterium sp.]
MVALCCVGFELGSYAILDNNEGLYAEIAREMTHCEDWHHSIIPHLNGLSYMEKPPLLYWLTALSFTAFGESALFEAKAYAKYFTLHQRFATASLYVNHRSDGVLAFSTSRTLQR